jgi:hypothetical protein
MSDTFVILAQLRENTQSDLVLNLLEKWMALCFKTLPDGTLEAWLGPAPGGNRESSGVGLESKKIFGLNVASPLDQGDKEASKGAFRMLKDSTDEMAKEYYWDIRKRKRPVIEATAVAEEQGNTWKRYLPQFLAGLTLGFVVGRWSATVGKQN